MSGDYRSALEAAGAKVLNFKEFGSYQGEWWGLVRYKRHKGFVSGSYGSCSGCDAFEAEFGFSEDRCEEHRYDWDGDKGKSCKACKEAKSAYQTKLANFGRQYLDGMCDRKAAIAEASRNLDWDGDAQSVVDWLKSAAWPPLSPNTARANEKLRP